jgi:N-acetylglucosaminyl-diphospho-decaprenol L-rhamnosyltransferase
MCPMTRPVPLVSVITVTYNSGDYLERLLDCLDAQTFQDFELILIDNGSHTPLTPQTRARIERRGRIVLNSQNTGFAAANNQAAKLASGTWLALLNPDAFPEPAWLNELVAATKTYPDVDAFGSTQLLDEDPTRLDGAGDVYHATGIPFRGGYMRPVPNTMHDGQPFTACAAAALWRKARFFALGGFEESFFCYCEDVDLGFRHRLAGGSCVQVARARVRHIGSASSGRVSDFAVYHGTRNRLWTFMRCMPLMLWPLLLPGHILATAFLWGHAWRRGCGSAYVRGVRDGLQGLGDVLRDRTAIQAQRTIGFRALMTQFAWSPMTLQRRSVVLRPVPAPVLV